MRKWIQLFENSDIKYTFSVGEETYRIVYEQSRNGNNPFADIIYLEASEIKRENHFIAWSDGSIVGMAGIEINPYNNTEMWGKFVSVSPDFRGMGIGGTLMRKVLQYCKDNGYAFSPSSYTEDGEQKLKPIVDKNY